MIQSSNKNSMVVDLHGHHKGGHEIQRSKTKLLFPMLKLGTWPQKMQTMVKCKGNTYSNMHKQKSGSNSPGASRAEPGTRAHDWEKLSDN